MKLVLLCALFLSSCASYDGPPVTFSGSYADKNGASFGGSVRLDPSFAKQKK